MIFSRFFKPQWQQKDPLVRLQAIKQLSAENAEQLTILKQLAEQDDNLDVIRSALLTINDFDYFVTVSEQHSNKIIRQFAQKQYQTLLLDNTEQLSLTTKQKAISLLPKSVLENWLAKEQCPELCIELYQRLAKPFLLLNLFEQKPNLIIQQFVIDQLNDQTKLEKLIKKAANDEIKQQIENKIAALIEAEQKPQRIYEQTQLMLSKLMALKDEKAFQSMQVKRQQLEQQWQQLSADFSCLATDQQQMFEHKYQHISDQVNKIFAQQQELYLQQQIAAQAAIKKQALLEQFNGQITALSQLVAEMACDQTSADEQQLTVQLTTLIETITATNELSDQQQQSLITKINQIQQQLARLPELADAIGKATQLIAQLSHWQMPNSLASYVALEPEYYQVQQHYKQYKRQAENHLPEAISTAFKQWQGVWQQSTLDYQQQVHQLFEQVKAKQQDLKRLIRLGKFNACFAIYRGMCEQFEQLTAKQQAKLQKDKTWLDDKISELSDWEHYVATPKKQALLTQIQQLAEQPLDNPAEQAKQVKQLRAAWETAGHASDDEVLNQQFNQVSEQAFAPCRLYFAEQDKIRAQHQQKREAIIAQAAQLAGQLIDNDDIHWKKLDSELASLKLAFKQAGVVDKNIYQQLNQQFKAAIKPIEQQLLQQQMSCAAQKQTIITQAEQLQQSDDDIFSQVEQLKQLQKQWKKIGFAGQKQERSLWQMFRAINDQVFELRDQQVAQNKSESQQQQQALFAELAKLPSLTDEAIHSLEQLKQIQQDHAELVTKVMAVKPALTEVLKACEQYDVILQQKLTQQQNLAQQQLWHDVFAVLALTIEPEQLESLENNQSFQALPATWQKRLVDMLQHNIKGDREQATLALEIIADKVPEYVSNEQRMAVQVELMQQKAQGQLLELEAQFKQWLQLGKLVPEQKPLLERVKALFVD